MKVQRNEMRRNRINKSRFFHKNLTNQKGKIFFFIHFIGDNRKQVPQPDVMVHTCHPRT